MDLANEKLRHDPMKSSPFEATWKFPFAQLK